MSDDGARPTFLGYDARTTKRERPAHPPLPQGWRANRRCHGSADFFWGYPATVTVHVLGSGGPLREGFVKVEEDILDRLERDALVDLLLWLRLANDIP